MKTKISQKISIKQTKTSARPKFYDKKKLLLELIPLLIFIIMLIGAIVYYPRVPNTIPTHWDASGKANGFSDKSMIFFVPAIFLFILILFFILPLMEVFRDNMIKIYKYYYAFKIFFSIFFLVLFIATLMPPLGYNINVSYVVIAMIAILFIAMGFIFPKIKRNFMFGIRTGWTMSSDAVWNKTHKIGGILFVALGLVTLILLFLLKLETLFFTFLILTMLVSIFLVFYSYYLYHKMIKS